MKMVWPSQQRSYSKLMHSSVSTHNHLPTLNIIRPTPAPPRCCFGFMSSAYKTTKLKTAKKTSNISISPVLGSAPSCHLARLARPPLPTHRLEVSGVPEVHRGRNGMTQCQCTIETLETLDELICHRPRIHCLTNTKNLIIDELKLKHNIIRSSHCITFLDPFSNKHQLGAPSTG